MRTGFLSSVTLFTAVAGVSAFQTRFGSIHGRFLRHCFDCSHNMRRSALSSISGSTNAGANNAMSSTTTTTSPAAQQAEGTCIVGGGLAGLATAAALRSIAGLESVQILERFSQEELTSRSAGAAVQLGPNGLRALCAIGGEAMVSRICEEGTCLVGNAVILPREASSPNENGENKVMFLPDQTKEDTGLPQVLIRWGVLRSLLLELLPSDCITTGSGDDIVGYSTREHDGRVCVDALSTSKEAVLSSTRDGSAAPPLLVAADGIYSTFQSLIHTGETMLPEDVEQAKKANIKDGGRVNIKAVAPADLGSDHRPGTTYSFFSPGGAVACFAGPAGKGFTYWAISVADETQGDGEATRFLSDVDRADTDLVKSRLLKRLKSLDTPECQFAIDMIEKTDAGAIFVARSEEREHVGPSLVSEDGLVVLVGDAAHSMSPAYGQAANFAFEDAATLATCIRDGDKLRTALDEYSESRVARCIEMQRRSAERTAKATRGEKTEDISKWIYQWTIE